MGEEVRRQGADNDVPAAKPPTSEYNECTVHLPNSQDKTPILVHSEGFVPNGPNTNRYAPPKRYHRGEPPQQARVA